MEADREENIVRESIFLESDSNTSDMGRRDCICMDASESTILLKIDCSSEAESGKDDDDEVGDIEDE